MNSRMISYPASMILANDAIAGKLFLEERSDIDSARIGFLGL